MCRLCYFWDRERHYWGDIILILSCFAIFFAFYKLFIIWHYLFMWKKFARFKITVESSSKIFDQQYIIFRCVVICGNTGKGLLGWLFSHIVGKYFSIYFWVTLIFMSKRKVLCNVYFYPEQFAAHRLCRVLTLFNMFQLNIFFMHSNVTGKKL